MPGTYRPNYDSGDGRRSPRDHSPARYNERNDRSDRDEYRGGSHATERRRSIPDLRSNNNAFTSNRDTFREPMGRESSRDFLARDPPRGPKSLIDAPTGPRASTYGSEFRDRGDYGYRGDYRGDRGRGRGRGWRDDSRDRARESDRNYRRDREDRGPPHFRDEPGRERWGRDSGYNRGRRASSPQGRARSPTYGPRDNRDPPPSLEIDRARRGSRDGPLSGGSPTTDVGSFPRGFGRAPRGGRGRGRGCFYDDHRRNSRSPEPPWGRRTQPSATPPPQVPAFGSNPISGPVPGVAVPTAPRSQRHFGQGHRATSVQLVSDHSRKSQLDNAQKVSRQSPESQSSNSQHRVEDIQSKYPQHCVEESQPNYPRHRVEEIQSIYPQHRAEEIRGEERRTSSSGESLKLSQPMERKRGPRMTQRQPKVPIPDSDTDSGDEIDDSYFEEEIAKYQQQIKQLPKANPLYPREDPEAPFFKPYIDANIDEVPGATKLAAPEPCVAAKVKQETPAAEPVLASDVPVTESLAPATLAPKSKGKSRSVTPLPEPEQSLKRASQKEAVIPSLEPSSSTTKRDLRKEAVIPYLEPSSSTSKNDPPKEVSIPPWDPSAFLQGSRRPSRNEAAGLDVKEPAVKRPGKETDILMLDAAAFLQGPSQPPIKTVDTPGLDVAAFLQGPRRDSHKEAAIPELNSSASLQGPRHDSRKEADIPGLDVDAFLQGPRRDSRNEAAILELNTAAFLVGPKRDSPKYADNSKFDAAAFLQTPSRVPTDADDKSSARTSSATPSNDNKEDSRPDQPLGEDKSTTTAKPRKPVMETFSESEGELTEAENQEVLEAVRKQMKTPPVDSLPRFNCKKWDQDGDFLKTLVANPRVEGKVKQSIIEKKERREREQAEAREDYKEKWLDYRRFCEFSDDPIAVKFREKFAKSRAKRAAEAAAPHSSSTPAVGAKPEGARRAQSRFATEHDMERVLRESILEAKETKEKEERDARAKTASAKEATIPDMAWDSDEWEEKKFVDRSHLVSFERSFAVMEFGEPIDNFTEEECRIFEEAYLEFPKQFTKIADALPGRDYKACIQHYYLVKHTSKLKEKLKKQPKKKKGRKAAGKNPKSNALMADLGLTIRDEGEDGQDAENGERRRPRRAAAPTWPFETPASESEVASPVPTPSRKTAATPKGEGSNDAPPTKRKAKAQREKGAKQTKNNPLLAAAPSTSTTRQPESPAPSLPSTEWKGRLEPSANPRGPSQFDGSPQTPQVFPPAFVPVEKASPSVPNSFETISQSIYSQQERLESAPPMNFEQQPERRNVSQTSSYWSVPEQTDFPALLKHFGTDWHGIAKYMTSKTHIMVYTNLFKQWLAVPSDSNKSRLVANIQTQVKNYYQRQVDSGNKREWEDFTREADERKERGEMPPDLPPTMMPKRRYDVTPSNLTRSGSAMDVSDDLASATQTKILAQASPPQSNLSSRFPALAQAGPVPQIQPATPTTVLNKHLPSQAPQQAPSQAQQPPRPPRGPALGYFTQNEPRESRDPRPIMQANTTVSERSLLVAQEAHAERQSALRLEREQREQQQQQQQQQQAAMQREQALQQQALQRERQSQLKQESEAPDLRQYEAYVGPQMHSGKLAQGRPEPPKATPAGPSESRRTTAPPHQFQPRGQSVRNFLGENITSMREIKSTSSPAVPRLPMSAPPATQEQFSTPPQPTIQHPPPQNPQHIPPQPPTQAAPPAPVAPIRQQETVRKTSSIMSLLNDEPSDPRPTPPKRVSDVSASALHPSRTPPPPQHSLQGSRYAAHPSQPNAQPTQMPPQMSAQPPAPQQTPLSSSQHSYGQPNPHPLHQHSSSIGHSRSYTPTGFDRSGYAQTPNQQQQSAQQQLYPQAPPRSTMPSQQPTIRREQSMGDIHGVKSGYARASAPSQPRLKESPYSQPTQPPQAQALRQQTGSVDLAPSADRDYYQRQPQPQYLMQQQQSTTSSPQAGSYHSQSLQQPQPSHRQLAFGQGPAHAASPPPQYASQHALHRSRHNSFDSRFQITSTSNPGSVPQGYAQAPQHQPTQPAGTPLAMQYQQQHPSHERYESNYERDRRLHEDAYHRGRLEEHRRVEEQRRMDEARR